MPAFGFNPFSFGKKPNKYPTQPVAPPFNPSRAPGGMAPPPGIPPAWMQPATGPEMPQPPDPTRPPPPPDPRLLPQAQMGPPGPQGPPQQPQPLGLPGQTGPKLSEVPPGMGDPFAGASEEQMQGIIGLGNMPEEMAGLDQQIAQAEALRFKDGPEGRDSGRVYTAASPLEHIGSLMQSHAQKRRLEGGKEALGGLIKAQPGLYNQRQQKLDDATRMRKSFFDIVRGQRPEY